MTADPRSDAKEVAVLVPAAGEGRRLGGPRKQFRTLGGRPLLVQTLLSFAHHPAIGHLVVAVPEGVVQDVSDRLHAEGMSTLATVVRGGASRQASVRHALRGVPSEVEVVLVHDAVRPFVAADEIAAVVEAVRAHGAAALALPVADTLRRGSEEAFGETVLRDGLYRMQTPQGFRRRWLEEAYRSAASEDVSATDDVALVQRMGRSVRPVGGSRRNFKITTAEDWSLAQQLWEPWTQDRNFSSNAPSA